MIQETQGDLLNADAEALVNTVNCVGVMGKGIALQFKRRFPDVFKEYTTACDRGEVQIGRMHVVPTGEIMGPKYVINFPTKRHWRSPSRLEYINEGLQDLRNVLGELGIRSIAIPPLGAGNGGLNWSEVHPLIEEALQDFSDVKVLLYAPSETKRSIDGVANLRMTWGRALMLDLLQEYIEQRKSAEPWEDAKGASHLEIQKLMYCAEIFEPRLKLAFQANRYGPYSERVRHLLNGMEGKFLSGFGDGSSQVLAFDPIRVTAKGEEELKYYKTNHVDNRSICDQVMGLIKGFEGPYGLELLATTHWVISREGANNPESATARVQAWSQRKGRIFTHEHVSSAFTNLEQVVLSQKTQ